MSAIRFVKVLAEHGVQRVVYTDTARDGMLGGPNLPGLARPGRGLAARDHPLRRRRAARRPAPPEEAATPPNVVGVIVGRALYEKSFTLRRRAGGLRRLSARRRAPQAHHPVPRRPRRARGQGRQLRRPSATPATPSSWRRATTPRAPTSSSSSTSPPRTSAATSSSTSRRAAPSRCSSRSPSAAGWRARTTSAPILAAGADKVTMNTAAVEDPELVRRCAERFGAQCIVVAIDARSVPGSGEDGRPLRWEVYVHGGRTPTGIDAVEWAARAAELGAGEFMLTSMDRDGTLDGYDLELTRAVAREVEVPVIASGGVGTLEHLAAGLTEGEADAVLAASIFHYGTYTIAEAKEYLAARGVPVRPVAASPARRPATRRRTRERTAPRRRWPGRTARDAAAAGRAARRGAPRLLPHGHRVRRRRPRDAGGRARPSSPPRAARPASRSRWSIRRWSCSRPRWRSGPGSCGAVRRAAAGAVHPAAAVPAGPGVPAGGRGAARTNGVWGVKETTVATLGVRVPAWPRGRAGSRRAAVPAARLERQPERGAAPRSRGRGGRRPAGRLRPRPRRRAGAAARRRRSSTSASTPRTRGWRILRRGTIDEKGVAALLAGDEEEPRS